MFKGRIGRFHWFVGNVLIFLVESVPFIFFPSLIARIQGTVVFAIVYLVVPITSVYWLSLTVRRLHDLDQPGRDIVKGLLPIANVFFFIRLLAKRGSPGTNQYSAR